MKTKHILIAKKNLELLLSLPNNKDIVAILKAISHYANTGEDLGVDGSFNLAIFNFFKEGIDFAEESYNKKCKRLAQNKLKHKEDKGVAVVAQEVIKPALAQSEPTPDFTTNNPQPSEVYDYYVDYFKNLNKNLKSLGTIANESFDFVYNHNVVEFSKKNIGLTKIAYLNNVKDYKKIIQYYFIKYFSTVDVKNDSLTYTYFKNANNFFGDEFTNIQQELLQNPAIFDEKLTELFKKINRSVTKTNEYLVQDGVAVKVEKKPTIDNVKDFLFLKHEGDSLVVDFLASCYSERGNLITTNMMDVTPFLMKYENTKRVTYETIQKVRSCLLSIEISVDDVKDSKNKAIKDYILNYFSL